MSTETKANVRDWTGGIHHRIAVLEGVSGRLRIDVRRSPVGVLHIEDGQAWFADGEEDADSAVVVDDPADFERILRGELNPFMAAIQGRVMFEERNSEFTFRALFALAATKPLASSQRGNTGKRS